MKIVELPNGFPDSTVAIVCDVFLGDISWEDDFWIHPYGCEKGPKSIHLKKLPIVIYPNQAPISRCIIPIQDRKFTWTSTIKELKPKFEIVGYYVENSDVFLKLQIDHTYEINPSPVPESTPQSDQS